MFTRMLVYVTQCRMWVLYLEFSLWLKAHENSGWNICNAQKHVICIFVASLLIHIRFSGDIYNRTLYNYRPFHYVLKHMVDNGKH